MSRLCSSTSSVIKWYQARICLFCSVIFGFLVILTHYYLSHHNLNLEIYKISNSWIIDRSQRPSLVVSVAMIYSTSVEERVIVAFLFVCHAIAPPTKVNKKPDVEQEELTFSPQSTLVHHCTSVDKHLSILELSAPKYALSMSTIFQVYFKYCGTRMSSTQ